MCGRVSGREWRKRRGRVGGRKGGEGKGQSAGRTRNGKVRTEGEKRDKGTGLGAGEKRGEGGIGSRGGRLREIEQQRVGKTEENGVGREEQRGTGSGAKKSCSRCPSGCPPGRAPETSQALRRRRTWAGSSRVCRTGQDSSHQGCVWARADRKTRSV